MKITKITCCRLCGSKRLETVFDFGIQALSTRFPGPDEPDAELVPLTLAQCQSCKLTQLTHDYDPDDLYRRGYGYRSGVNQTMRDHLAGIAQQLESHVKIRPNDTVLDIASNDGTLLRSYTEKKLNLVGIDPTITQYRSYYPNGSYLSSDFFSQRVFESISPTKKAKAISSIAVFYDVPDPVRFTADIASVLETNGVWVMEQSYLPLLVADLSFDSICHEHLGYYCLKQIEFAAENAGLRVFDAETNSMNGGSIRAFICHAKSRYSTNEIALAKIAKLEAEAKLDCTETFNAFYTRVNEVGEKLLKVLKNVKAAGKTVHVYGASTKGNVLLQLFGIDRKLIDAASERNEWKFGHRTPGTNIPIISEEASRAQKPDYYLVLPWHFRNEFVEREQTFINNGGKLIFPLPNVEVYPAD
ncbi:MAG: class I SAM-dependent methyltransferase [Pseudomonadota bacterium]|nr:class I SAM-dependent methyltransferase [Pseudomonadota bacterium]